MPTEQGRRPTSSPRCRPAAFRLGSAAAALYGDSRLSPFLGRLLLSSGRLLGTVAGGISLIDASGQRYAKVAERGASCQLGHSFPLDEGVSGRVVAGRRPVTLASYRDVRAGHLPSTSPASRGAVVGVPIWWRGEVIGANVAFAGRSRRFTAAEIDELEALTQIAAAGIVRAGTSHPSLAHLLRHRPQSREAAAPTVVSEAGTVRPVSAAVADVAVDLVTLAERTADRREPTAGLRVAVVHRPEGVRLLVHDPANPAPGDGADDPLGTGARTWHELAASAGGGVTVEQVAGWGVLVRADFPYAPTVPAGGQPVEPSPLTPREGETLALVARGHSDREIASALGISPKTVEKHVGAILRKTGTAGRTAAVVRALGRGWLPAGTPGCR